MSPRPPGCYMLPTCQNRGSCPACLALSSSMEILGVRSPQRTWPSSCAVVTCTEHLWSPTLFWRVTILNEETEAKRSQMTTLSSLLLGWTPTCEHFYLWPTTTVSQQNSYLPNAYFVKWYKEYKHWSQADQGSALTTPTSYRFWSSYLTPLWWADNGS